MRPRLTVTRRFQLIFTAFLFLFLASCGKDKGMSLADVKAQTQGKSIALVSLSVNDYNGMLSQWGQTAGPLLEAKMNGMLSDCEGLLGQKWTVVPAADFVGKSEYQSIKGPEREVAMPTAAGESMRLFGADRKDLVATRVDGTKVSALATAAGADLVVVMYSEWEVATGSFSPTSKPFTKNVMSIYDSTGKLMFHGRQDQMGEKPLGAFGIVAVDEETVDDWVKAAVKGYTAMLSQG
jgi:hypothetical protein